MKEDRAARLARNSRPEIDNKCLYAPIPSRLTRRSRQSTAQVDIFLVDMQPRLTSCQSESARVLCRYFVGAGSRVRAS